MSSSQNAQKTPIAVSLERWGQRKVQGVIALTGKALPASVVSVVSSGIVTVKFNLTNIPYTLPNVTVPLFGPEYIRYPIQPGCLGVVFPADAYLGGVSGLGGGTADLSQRANLTALVFFPIGNKGWSATDDANAVVIYGPDGVILRDSASKGKLQIQPTVVEWNLPTGVSLVINGNVVINGNQEITGGLALGGNITAQDGHSVYAGNIETSGSITAGYGGADAVELQSHTHKYNNPDGASTVEETEAPTAGT
jgi:hypothetical protein